MTALPATCAPPRAALAAPPAAAVLGMLLAALLLAAPLPLACAPAGPRAWLAAGVGAVAAAVALAGLLRGRGAPPPPAALPFGLFLLLIAAQLLPIAGPAAPEVLGDAVPTHLSLVPARTAARGIDLLAWFGCFAAAAALLASARRARRFLGCLLGLAAALAVYGLLAWQGALPLVDAQQPRTVLVATFVNRNHLAHLLGLGALVGLGLFAALRQRGAPPALLALTGAGIAAAVLGIVGTQSRGGFVALAVGICAFPLLAMRSRRRRRAGLAIGLTAAIAAVLWLLPAGLLQRFSAVGGELQAPGTRTDIWRGAIALWAQFPWTGTGLGTFGDLSPATQPAAVPGRVEHAHSDPLELLAETGAAGALLLAAAVLAFAVPMVRRCLGHRDRERALLAAGGLAALAATAVHALVEFHLQIPANAAWTAAVAGLVAGVLRSPRPAPARPWFGVALLAAG
ncbi:MAG: O-antigen ligase family protein, partial [Planctomycetes bacterium]|nr:O-antigen ligase family protein [Planctomycetota bacterium]